jgi:hypothetical protein
MAATAQVLRHPTVPVSANGIGKRIDAAVGVVVDNVLPDRRKLEARQLARR